MKTDQFQVFRAPIYFDACVDKWFFVEYLSRWINNWINNDINLKFEGKKYFKIWGQTFFWSQIWGQANFWSQAKILFGANFGAKIDPRPTLRPGQARPSQWARPGFIVWHILSFISFVVCQASVVSLPFVAYRSFHSHRLQKRRRNDAARLIQAVYRGWYVRRFIQNLKRKVRHTLRTEPQTQGMYTG